MDDISYLFYDAFSNQNNWFIAELIFAMQSKLKTGWKFKFMTFCCNYVRSVKRALSK